MPELHANQIRWEAPEPQKVAFDKPDYTPLADAMNYLSGVADDIAQRQIHLLDEDLKADLKLAEAEANQLIDNAASGDVDYNDLSQQALSKVQGAFYKYDDATRVRFTREHKTYFDELQLAISEKILKKETKELETRVDINIPRWASEVFMGRTEEEREQLRVNGIKKIQTTLQGYSSPDVIDQKVYEFNHMIDKTNINELITQGTDESLAKARAKYINNPDNRASLNPYEVSVFNSRIVAQENANAEAKKTKMTPEMSAVLQEYARFSRAGNTPMAKLIKQIVWDGGLVPIEVAQDENGSPIYDYVDASQITEFQVEALNTKMKNFDDMNPRFEQDAANYNNTVNDVLEQYLRGVKNKSSEQTEASVKAQELIYDDMFKELPKETRNAIVDIHSKQIKAKVEAAGGQPQSMMIYLPLPYRTDIGNPAVQTSQLLASGDYLVGTTHVNVNENTIDATTRWLQDNGLLKTPDMEPLPYDFKTGSPTRYTAGVPVDEGGFFSSSDTYKPYDKSLSNSIVGTANIYTDRFMKDAAPNSLAVLGVFNKVVLQGLNKSGQLKDTRFDRLPDGYIEDRFDAWISYLKANQKYNLPALKSDGSEIKNFYKSLINGKPFTSQEENVIAQAEQLASVAFNGDETNPVLAAYNVLTRGAVKSGAISETSGANYHKQHDLMKSSAKRNISSKIQKSVE